MKMLPARHHRLVDIKSEELRGGMRRKLIVGQKLMLAEVCFAKGDVVPRHSHENEQMTQVISGAMHFWFGDKDEQEMVLRAGEIVTIPAFLPHRAEILEDTVSFDIFTPPRADWLAGTDAYLRG
ncbi:MAG: cupin domain-containing protein [Hyphomicrobiales bacterium]|nr:cupin domain-containing protein [Hyphomicrobiales bacterium]